MKNAGIGIPEGTSVMIIDDTQDNIDVIARRLVNRGIKVTECNDGAEALEMLGSVPVDIVLCDVMMPGMSGVEIVQKIRTKRSQAALPIIMVSARTDQQMIVECLQAGANDYVTKPIDFQIVCARIHTQLTIRDTYKAALTDRARQMRKAEEALAQLADAQVTIAELRKAS